MLHPNNFLPPLCDRHNTYMNIAWYPADSEYTTHVWECSSCIREFNMVSLAPVKWAGWPEGAEL